MKKNHPIVIRVMWDDEKLERIIHLLEKFVMPNLADIQAKADDINAKVTAEKEVDDSVVVLLTGLVELIKSLKQQLADAIAANDPVAVQKVLDSLDAAGTTLDAEKQKLADAVVAGTPSA